MQLEFLNKECIVRIEPTRPLAELSFGIEQGAYWFLGSGCSRFEVHRRRVKGNDSLLTEVNMTAMKPMQELSACRITQLGGLVQTGLFPKEIPPNELWTPTTIVTDGAHRISKEPDEYFVAAYRGLNPKTPMATLGFGICDMIVDMFLRGAKTVRWQGSLDQIQLWADIGMNEVELSRYHSDDYDASRPVGVLKWS